MSSEKLDQDGMAAEALDFEECVLVIQGAERGERLPKDQIRLAFRLAREQAERDPDEATRDGNGGHCSADPSGVSRERGGPEPDAHNTDRVEKSASSLERHAVDQSNPEDDRDGEETERQNTENESIHLNHSNSFLRLGSVVKVVAQGGLEPPTPQFSVECSTN
jgi:hypothetical protein